MTKLGMTKDVKTYAAPWDGELVLACRKCQKKLKGDAELGGLAKLKKAFKRYNKLHPDRMLALLNVPCMDLCPKGGVTVCSLAEKPVRLRILRSEDEIGQLLSES